ncbi:MAG: TRAP transporter large permease [Ectothiorhodospiraceae bacterium]|nr:TRAP transporter large permease [Ectothiorhodospiraceae bacterium]
MTESAWLGVYGFALLLALIAINIPIGFAMGIAGIVGLYFLMGPDAAMHTLGIVASGDFVSYSLSVIPLFVLMGVAAASSGMSQRLYSMANHVIGHARGGLGMATIGSAALFSSVCGSSIATAATMAKVAMPEMRRHAYDDGLAAGSIAAGGALGMLIPPSVILIVYALITETSIILLFAAALVPGLLAVAFYIVVIAIVVRVSPGSGPASRKESLKVRLRSLLDAVPVIILFLLVLGGIYGGVFTPTEAAAVGAVGSLVYFLATRGFNRSVLKSVFLETMATTGMIFIIVIGAGLFTFFLSYSGLPRVFAMSVAALELSPIVIALPIVALYLVLGCFMESLGIVILTVPVLFPLIQILAPEFGMTSAEAAVWFGVFVVIAVEIGLLTPPLGLNVFVIKGAVGDVELSTIYKGVLPFWLSDLLRLILLILFPGLALYLPSLL